MKGIGIVGGGRWGMGVGGMVSVRGNDVVVWWGMEKEMERVWRRGKEGKVGEMKKMVGR